MDDLLDLARVHRPRAAVLVVVMLFLGLILRAAWIHRVRISGGKEPTTGGAQAADVGQWA